MKKDEMGGHAACTMNMISAHGILVGKSEGKIHHCRWWNILKWISK
jgi:hypothetical protein